MFCPSCGSETPGTARFCANCGTALPTLASAPPTSEPAKPQHITAGARGGAEADAASLRFGMLGERPIGVRRPGGVTFLGIWYLFLAALSIAGGLMVGLGNWNGVLSVLGGAVGVVLGVGLWKLREWARVITIVLTCLFVLGKLASMARSLGRIRVPSLVFTLLILAFNSWVVWYLTRLRVKKAFGVT